MDRIDEYVNEIYRKFDTNDQDTRILIEETKSHLYDEVGDFRKQGFNEKESIEKAIYNFGKENVVINEMNGVLKRQNKFSKVLIIIAVVIFTLGTAFKLINIVYDISGAENNRTAKYENDQFFSYNLIHDIREKLSGRESIDENLKNDITQLLDEFNIRTNNGIYDVDIIDHDNQYVYSYNKDTSKEACEINNSGGASGDGYWTIEYEKTDIQSKYDSFIMDKIFERSLPYELNECSCYLFILSWILICISLFNNVYIKDMISKEYIIFYVVSSCIILLMLALDRHAIRDSMVFIIGFLLLGGAYYNKNYLKRKLNNQY